MEGEQGHEGLPWLFHGCSMAVPLGKISQMPDYCQEKRGSVDQEWGETWLVTPSASSEC